MIQKALEDTMDYDGDLHIFIGSADKFETVRNPLPIEFRMMLIKGALHETFSAEILKRIHIHPLNDLSDEADNSYAWGRYLFMKMLGYTHDPDMTIYYSDNPQIMLSWFDSEDRWCLRFKFLDRVDGLSATKVRDAFSRDNRGYVEHLVPNFVFMHYDEIRNYIIKSERN